MDEIVATLVHITSSFMEHMELLDFRIVHVAYGSQCLDVIAKFQLKLCQLVPSVLSYFTFSPSCSLVGRLAEQLGSRQILLLLAHIFFLLEQLNYFKKIYKFSCQFICFDFSCFLTISLANITKVTWGNGEKQFSATRHAFLFSSLPHYLPC